MPNEIEREPSKRRTLIDGGLAKFKAEITVDGLRVLAMTASLPLISKVKLHKRAKGLGRR